MLDMEKVRSILVAQGLEVAIVSGGNYSIKMGKDRLCNCHINKNGKWYVKCRSQVFANRMPGTWSITLHKERGYNLYTRNVSGEELVAWLMLLSDTAHRLDPHKSVK